MKTSELGKNVCRARHRVVDHDSSVAVVRRRPRANALLYPNERPSHRRPRRTPTESQPPNAASYLARLRFNHE